MADQKLSQLTGVVLPIQNSDLFYVVRGGGYFQVGATGLATAPIFTGTSGQFQISIDTLTANLTATGTALGTRLTATGAALGASLTATGAALGASITSHGIRYVGFSMDGVGSVFSTGLKSYNTIPYAGTIVSWNISASPSGSCAVDIYKITSGVGLPTSSIVNNVPPSLNNGYFQDTTGLATWATAVTGGDRVGWVVLSASGTTKMTFTLGIQT